MTAQEIAEMEFQSTLPQRERLNTIFSNTSIEGFQSTLPQRERRKSNLLTSRLHYFNPRSHKGSDSDISQNN